MIFASWITAAHMPISLRMRSVVCCGEVDSAFQRHGITRIEAMGQKLDPNRHQAMIEIPSDAEPGTVIEEMQAGYVLKDRLLRPALVGVARKG